MRGSFISWLKENRTSVRSAFGMRIVSMGLGSLLGLLFPRLLVQAMGADLYGLWLTFQSVTRLGGLSDLGMGGAIALRTGQYLGQKQDSKLRELLASARSIVLLLSSVCFLAFVALSPWLPRWLKFDSAPGSGSLTLLMIVGGMNVAVVLLAGYFHSLNFALGTVTWPVIPTVLIGQILAPAVQVWLAIYDFPLWVQLLPYSAATIAVGALACSMVKWAHPWVGTIWPLGFNLKLWKELAGTSGWVYLSSIGNAIYFATDRVLILPGFGGAAVTKYFFNYKICDLATMLILTASFVSIPKITQWLASGQEAEKTRALKEVNFLNTAQILMGCTAALGYLAFNDLFIALWQGAEYQMPLSLQIAFACNLAATTGGDAGIQVAGRCGNNGIKQTGIAVGGTGLLNLGLSYLSMRLGFLTGIAIATAIAQIVLSLSLGWITCRYLKLSPLSWSAKSCLLPLAVVGIGGLCRTVLKPDSVAHVIMLVVSFGLILLVAALAAGVNREMISREWSIIKGMLGR
ncbi:hypothetical protein [Pedosphaera parvula]|uniref:Polysaccharide biosynthesis protein n=1 Tax=Pedosphaera parvula (strain Ellin514) TaxID=320771 RepID=B9XKP0_PEDPL|nr:hypothetical protein [Pedosphaera parvula]EEF59533.1 hypothetical protein Cflav_PD2440 [Pedosphaera parvula Ellin514]